MNKTEREAAGDGWIRFFVALLFFCYLLATFVVPTIFVHFYPSKGGLALAWFITLILILLVGAADAEVAKDEDEDKARSGNIEQILDKQKKEPP